ncbi:heavy-metal-associated domain-containing protein [Microcoleus sp. FACHB-1515]|uniref:heavy-metal-associated domain-containing protein n=1 Tax=Cyanophyceae TaxID=3028117 RepID=UPI0016874A51|nr:heavy-metal-associated domain-containing protein [Microcoleus sp. FACHB-1515]MBD2093389.1 heavy-metal-associated domain-containing protein [Microcoleus sp. FACHB-1515]
MTVQLNVPNLACPACVNTVTTAIKSVDSNAAIEADPKTKVVNIETRASQDEIEAAIAAVGYPAA